MRHTVYLPLLAVAVTLSAAPSATTRIAAAQGSAPPAALHRPLDQILDVNVRDGLVYYRALKSERGRLDRYAASLNVPAATYASWSADHKMAFWVNAYNAFVLQTVVDQYPIRGGAQGYPANSIRQIPGAFDKTPHRAAGRSVTLDEIEKTILPEFKEPRLQLALGRGAIGSGRLSSEAYDGARLQAQLDRIRSEFVNEQTMLKIDRTAGVVSVTPIVSWHQDAFVAAYDQNVPTALASRSPVERAVVMFVMPHLLSLEKELVQANRFKVSFHPFDWRLNDLTGGRPQ
jgi:hypothetical protein